MAIYQVWLFFTVLLLPEYGGGAFQEDNCKVMRCNKHHGPDIRFPFWLKDRQSPDCGYPGFELSCTRTKHTVLDLPFPLKSPNSANQTNPPNSVKLQVKEIDYKLQLIHISEINGCLPRLIPDLNFSASPFQFPRLIPDLYFSASPFQFTGTDGTVDITVFSCPMIQSNYYMRHIPCLSSPGNHVYSMYSDYPLNEWPVGCSRMYNISAVRFELFHDSLPIELNWSQPACGPCEAKGKFCRLKKVSLTQEETECLPRPSTRGTVVGLFLAAVFLYCLITSLKAKKEDQLKIEKFLEDYEALKPTRYSYADIKKITNNFSERVGQGGYGTVYKGKLSDEIYVAVKVLENSTGNGEDFVNEVSTIGLIHHVNIVRLVGYCADGFKRALVYEFMPNDSLAKFVQSPHRINSLGWDKLRHISLCIAKGIEYLHQGCDQRILHFDIKPQNILLDCNFNPKISDFGLAKLCSKEQSAVSMTATRGTMGYIAPEVFSRNFGNVSYKSDVYSFGMLLLEIVGATTKKEKKGNDDVYFPEWIYKKLEAEDNLRLGIEEVCDGKIARRLTIVGLRCIQWYPVNRPSMKAVIQMLEGEDDNLSVPQNPFVSMNNNDGATTTRERAYTGEPEVIFVNVYIVIFW